MDINKFVSRISVVRKQNSGIKYPGQKGAEMMAPAVFGYGIVDYQNGEYLQDACSMQTKQHEKREGEKEWNEV
jgi:hypothetical protein